MKTLSNQIRLNYQIILLTYLYLYPCFPKEIKQIILDLYFPYINKLLDVLYNAQI